MRRRRLWVEYDGQKWPVTVYRRKAPRLTIRVLPDLSVQATAPVGHRLSAIRVRVQRRAGWISRQRQRFSRFHPFPPPRRYISGETHLYLGRQYRLKVHPAAKRGVKLLGCFFHVHTPRPRHRPGVRQLLESWYDVHAKHLFAQRLQAQHARLSSLKLPKPRLRVQQMVKRWGSCTKEGTILLNRNLVKTPSECVDYVIVHELCHLREHGHGSRFQRLLSTVLPDWPRRKERLNSFVL